VKSIRDASPGLLAAVLFSFLLVPCFGAEAPTSSPTDQDASAPVLPKLSRVSAVRPPARLGSTVVVKLEGLAQLLLDEAQKKNVPVGLFLDGEFLRDVPAQIVPDDPKALQFRLVRTDTNRSVWGHVLGEWLTPHTVKVNLGLEDKTMIVPDTRSLTFEPLRGPKMVGLVLLSVASVLFTLVLAWRTSLLKDDGSETFSLGRAQMAFWFLNVLIAFLMIWGITGAADTLTPSMLVLIGISAGTALGSITIDQNKQAEKAAEGRPLTSEKTRGFLMDLLRDGQGISLHRLQIVVWTVVLACLFWGEVYHNLSMPDFDSTLLGLMGVSSATYLGFKLPTNGS
jgi:hypothetical protein